MKKETYALITGSSMGLGKAFAEKAAAEGWNLILAALPDTGLKEVSRDLELRFRIDVEYFEIDLTEHKQMSVMVKWILWNGVHVDLLINNAGVGCPGSFDEAPSARLESVVAVNAQAVTQLTYQMVPILKKHSPSTIINVASLAGFYPMPAMAVYAATKSYVLNFSLALREELSSEGINVSVLCPGGITTNPEVNARIDAQGLIGRLSGKTPEDVASFTLKRALNGRAIIIPGLLNKLLRMFGTSIPRRLVAKVIGGRFKKTEELARMSDSKLFAGALQTVG